MKIENSLDISPFKETFQKVHTIMEIHEGENIRIAYSAGLDSDCVMWLFRELGYNVPAVFYDTGLEFRAAFEHVEYMRGLGFDIEIARPKYKIPYAQRKFGTPFLNKNTSDMLYRLQKHDFNFKEDGKKNFDELWPSPYSNCKTALLWWTNSNRSKRFNIEWNRGLKEFLIENDGVPFRVSPKCCDIAKKNLMKKYAKDNEISLVITGIRKAEGGRRSMTFHDCYLPPKENKYSMYFPLFWWKQADRNLFEETLGFQKSKCYTLYGMPRTGCVGCPFGRLFEEELSALEKYEPKMHKLATHIFKDSYRELRKYREFVEDGFEPLEKE